MGVGCYSVRERWSAIKNGRPYVMSYEDCKRRAMQSSIICATFCTQDLVIAALYFFSPVLHPVREGRQTEVWCLSYFSFPLSFSLAQCPIFVLLVAHQGRYKRQVRVLGHYADVQTVR